MNCFRYRVNYRNLVTGVDAIVPLESGRYTKAINFGNAATTPPFISSLKEIMNFSPFYGPLERGTGYKSEITSDIYENSRRTIMDFLGADTKNQTLIYVKNTTEAINKLANILDNSKKDVVICTEMEHHSNDLPWRERYKVCYAEVDEDGVLKIDDIEDKLKKYKNRVRLIAVTGASNVTGYINDIHKIAALAHKYGTEILVDGAQLVPHVSVNIKNSDHKEHIDYIAFSAHKMYAPFGIGVLIGPKTTFEKCLPDCKGGGMVDTVTYNSATWANPPEKDECGTQNVMGVVALLSAVKTLQWIGMENIKKYEDMLTRYTIERLKNIDGIQTYGNYEERFSRVGIITFNIDGISDDDTAQILSREAGISVRNGKFCAQPYSRKLMKIDDNSDRGMVRISFGLYNTYEEIDILIDLLNKICSNKKYYLEHIRK